MKRDRRCQAVQAGVVEKSRHCKTDRTQMTVGKMSAEFGELSKQNHQGEEMILEKHQMQLTRVVIIYMSRVVLCCTASPLTARC